MDSHKTKHRHSQSPENEALELKQYPFSFSTTMRLALVILGEMSLQQMNGLPNIILNYLDDSFF